MISKEDEQNIKKNAYRIFIAFVQLFLFIALLSLLLKMWGNLVLCLLMALCFYGAYRLYRPAESEADGTDLDS